MRDDGSMVPKPPEKIYVSEVASALEGGCAYRLLLNYPPIIHVPEWLMPQNNKTILGTVFHELLDEVSEGRHPQADLLQLLTERSKERFQGLIESGRMALEPNLDSAESISAFRRKAGRLDQAREGATPSSTRTSTGIGLPRSVGREVFVEGLGGRITGRIDEVKKERDGAVISDDKTGLIRSEDGTVKPVYRRQVLLYAALWSKQWDEPVKSVRLCSRSGAVIWEQGVADFSTDMESYYSDAESLLHRLDRADEDAMSLAEPTHGNCGFCEHRITCEPHRSLENEVEQGQPCVFSGQLERVFPLPGSKLKLTLTINGSKVQTTVNNDWFLIGEDEPLPVEVRLHAFYPDDRHPGRLNARTSSHAVVRC